MPETNAMEGPLCRPQPDSVRFFWRVYILPATDFGWNVPDSFVLIFVNLALEIAKFATICK